MKSTQKWVNGAIRKGHDRFTNNCIVMFPIRRKWTSILILMGQFLFLLMKIEKQLTKLLSPLTEINLLFNSWYVAWSLCHHSSPVPCAMATLNVITVVNLCFICQVQSGRWEIVFKHMFRSLDIEYVCHIAKWSGFFPCFQTCVEIVFFYENVYTFQFILLDGVWFLKGYCWGAHTLF